MSKVLVVDDHPVVLEGIQHLLAAAGDFSEVAVADSGKAAVSVADDVRPDLVVLDLRLRDALAPDLCREILRTVPDAKIIILTAFDDENLLRACLDAGARGILLKDARRIELVKALREVSAGKVVIDDAVAGSLGKNGRLMRDPNGVVYERLRPREYEVLRLMAEGLSTKEIAGRLDLATNTVRSYTQSLMTKLHARTRVQAILAARRLRLI